MSDRKQIQDNESTPRNNPNTDLITLRECAGILGISYNTAKQWSSRGILPAPVVVISARHKRWSKTEVLALGRQK